MNGAPLSPEDLARFLAAARGNSGPVRAFRAAGGQGAITTACSADDAEALAAVVKRPPPGFRICKFGSRSVVGGYELPSGSVALKYYFPRHWHKCVTYGLLGSRARRSWLAALGFSRIGIGTPEPLALLEWKAGPVFLRQSFLATRFGEGDDLQTWAENHADDRQALETMAGKLRAQFDLMARFRAVHGDMKASNILVAADGSIRFIDLDAAALLVPASRWPALREKDRRRFAANWTARPPLAEAFADVFAPAKCQDV